MKYVLIILGLIVGMASCDSSKRSTRSDALESTSSNDTLRIANDSLEYEILIIEPGFNNWLVTQFPEEYYSLSYLENRNTFYVQEYNRRVLSPVEFDAELYPIQINYELDVKYGKEVNYLLYNYFVYFERTYNQKLL